MAETEKLPTDLLQRRLRALILVGSLLGPAFCVFGVLSFLAEGWARWFGLSVWVGLGALLGLLVARLLRTLAALDRDTATAVEPAVHPDEERPRTTC